MKKAIKNIHYDNKNNPNSYFDIVRLEDIFEKAPKDHNQFKNHKVSFYVLMLITKNEGVHSINFQDHAYSEGTLFTIRRNSIHKFYRSEARGKMLVFTEDFVMQYLSELQSLKLFQLFNELLGSSKLQLSKEEFIEVMELMHQIEKEYREVNDIHSLEIIRGLLHVLTMKLFRIKSKGNGIFEKSKYLSQFILFQKLLERDCFENKKVDYYAKVMNITSRTLNNITHSIVHKSAKAFIDEILIIQIKGLLINSQFTISEIAYQAGFDDPTYFFKYFRKKTGLSPKQFKENI